MVNINDRYSEIELLERAIFMDNEGYSIDQIIYEILALNAENILEFQKKGVKNEEILLKYSSDMKEKGVDIELIVKDILGYVNMSAIVN